MLESSTVGAVDAGSNAIRVVVARATAGSPQPERLDGIRVPVRLGHSAFTVGELDAPTIDAAVETFSTFRELFDRYNVMHYRAVATSAVRNARNRDILLHRLFAETGIQLEVITGEEEARLIRKAVRNALREQVTPTTILDLGGGSLEVNVRHQGRWRAASLPIGTVRLRQMFGLMGMIDADEANMVRRYVRTLLHTFVPDASHRVFSPTVAAGGNAEAYAKLLGTTDDGVRSFTIRDLERALPDILRTDVPTRMREYGVRQDRAEVMAIAGLVLATAGRELRVERFVIPGVGIRDALLYELAATLPALEQRAPSARAKAVKTGARMFASRLGHDIHHGEIVRKLARQIFEQTREVHGLPDDMLVALELAALLHDVGEVVHGRSHHKHGEYLVRHGRIAGLDSPLREIAAALVRGHRKSLPTSPKHETFSELSGDRQRQVMKLLAILRLADALDTDHRQRVTDVVLSRDSGQLTLELSGGKDTPPTASMYLRKARLFEQIFGIKVRCRLR